MNKEFSAGLDPFTSSHLVTVRIQQPFGTKWVKSNAFTATKSFIFKYINLNIESKEAYRCSGGGHEGLREEEPGDRARWRQMIHCYWKKP